MWTVFILLALAVTVNTQGELNNPYGSAASESQIRFALENRYDDTGPGAKGPEYAYNTYKSLEEALVSYIGDKDTKLPEYERAKVERFVNTDFSEPIRELPKTVEEYTGLKPSRPIKPVIRGPVLPQPIMQSEEQFLLQQPLQYRPVQQEPIFQPIYSIPKPRPDRLFFQEPKPKYSFLDFRSSDLRQRLQNEKLQPFRVLKTPRPYQGPIKNFELNDAQFDPQPQYTFSYGVHDKKTGDSKSAHESRNGGNVKGYYTFIDPDGKQRTVHYTADDKYGFRATVQRTLTNTQ